MPGVHPGAGFGVVRPELCHHVGVQKLSNSAASDLRQPPAPASSASCSHWLGWTRPASCTCTRARPLPLPLVFQTSPAFPLRAHVVRSRTWDTTGATYFFHWPQVTASMTSLLSSLFPYARAFPLAESLVTRDVIHVLKIPICPLAQEHNPEAPAQPALLLALPPFT